MIAIGLDGFRNGWVAVRIDGGERQLFFLDDVSRLGDIKFDCAAIDSPIGLPNSGTRICDLEARTMLRPHSSRVFTGARRGLWDFGTAAEANAALHARGETGISLQLWNLGPKILEIDRFVGAHPRCDLREAHPELVFLRLNGFRPLPSKKTVEGIALRCALLGDQGFAVPLLDQWLGTMRLGRGAKRDDVLDACAAAIAARDFDKGFVLPAGEAPVDARGLKMQIWY